MKAEIATTASRIFLVDDHALVREGLRKLIEQETDLVVCGEAETADTALAAVSELQPEVVLVDLSLRTDSGLDLIKRLHQLPQAPRLLVLSMHDELHYAERALRAGASGYVMKRETSGRVLEAIRTLLAGQVFVSPAVSTQMAGKMMGSGRRASQSPIERLSDRELEVFLRLGQGQETRRIAEELHLSLKTIHTHCAHLKEKLGLENATALMLEAVRWVESQSRR